MGEAANQPRVWKSRLTFTGELEGRGGGALPLLLCKIDAPSWGGGFPGA